MSRHFSHPQFISLSFEEVPLNTDLYLVDEKWLREWEAAWVHFFEGEKFENVGYVSEAIVRRATADALEVSWYPNRFDRFHEVVVTVPRDAFITCVEVYDYDDKPCIFVHGEWLTALHLRPYSAFALIDAIGVKDKLNRGELPSAKLVALRERIDAIAGAHPGVAFVSFADSLLLKTNWFIGTYDSEVSYSYEPEVLVHLFSKVAAAYREVLDFAIYAVITQGVNEYPDTSLIHSSPSGSHVSLNSLGLPFSQLLAIDNAVRSAIRSKVHDAYDLYIDGTAFHSLRFKCGFDKHVLQHAAYVAPMSSLEGKYYCATTSVIIDNLDRTPPPVRRRAKKRA